MAIAYLAFDAYEEHASPAELASLHAGLAAEAEPAPNEREQRKEAFLVSLPGYARRVCAVATIARSSGAVDLVWVFWPHKAPTSHDRGEPVERVLGALRIQAEELALVADIERLIEALPAPAPVPPMPVAFSIRRDRLGVHPAA